jgi:hypothetical protein
MVLIRCPACSKEISAEARSCPGCGHPIRRKSFTWARTKRIGAATLGILLAVVQVAVQSAQDQLGILLIALGIVAAAIVIVKGVARLRGSRPSRITIDLTVLLAPAIVFLVMGMGSYGVGAGLGAGVSFWIISALLRIGFTARPASVEASSAEASSMAP